ncbi:MAG: HAD family hydrolase [Candidatus Sulfotelmatobacter sp.]
MKNSSEKKDPIGSGSTTPVETIHCSALLFDLDGVLIDSTPAVARVWSNWATERGFDPKEVVEHAHGRPSISTIRHFLPDSDHELENREVEQREINDVQGIIVLPGAHELLKSLSPDRWTIATSCTRRLAEVRLRAAGLPIPERMVTSTDVTNGKPHPEPFLKAAAKLSVAPAECVVFEDVPAGIRAGKAAGARVIALRTTFEQEALRTAGADFVLNSCAGVSATSGPDGLTLRLARV